MKLQDWQNLVAQTIAENPDWLTATQQALTAGIKSRLDSERDARATAETALVICAEKALPKLPKGQGEVVKQAIRGSKMFAGTEFANNL
jgi:hypothetical protein